MFEHIEAVFGTFVSYSIVAVELVGVFALLAAVGNGVVGYFKRDRELRLKLAEGIALALEFKMGAEIIKTVIIHNLEELAILGVVIIIRALLAFIIHWEIRLEEKTEAAALAIDSEKD